MEKLHGPINPCFIGEHLNVECYDQGDGSFDFSYESFLNTESMSFVEEEQKSLSTSTLPEKMPFLQMLQRVESLPSSSFTEPNIHVLLRLEQQQKKAWGKNYLSEMDCQIQALELESCITHDISEAHSPIKSQHQYPYSSSCPEVVSSECNREPNSPNNYRDIKPSAATREKRKRKRIKSSKNKEEVESQRMTHIAVERNRRRQMNDHLNALRSLMPTSFVQRGDQASIIGGAIDFVKELEQLLQSLQTQKKTRKTEKAVAGNVEDTNLYIPVNGFKHIVEEDDDNGGTGNGVDFIAENKSAVADIQVVVIQKHVNLKILSPRRPGQLLKVIASFEDLRLIILHLNITSLEHSVLYSFSLKIEDECKLGSADEIASAVHQIFSCINGQ